MANPLERKVTQLEHRLAKLERQGGKNDVTAKRKHVPKNMMLPHSIGGELLDMPDIAPGQDSFPLNPVDGQFWRYPTGINAVSWFFQWDAQDAAWYAIGCSPIIDNETNDTIFSSGTSWASGTPDVGPTLTIPFDGYYTIQCFAGVGLETGGISHHAEGQAAYSIGATPPADADSLWAAVDTSNNGEYYQFSSSSPAKVKLIAASDVIEMQYQNLGTSGSADFFFRSISVTPILVTP